MTAATKSSDPEFIEYRYKIEPRPSGSEVYTLKPNDILEIMKVPVNNIWTVMSCPEFGYVVRPGYRVTNRIGYIITEEHWKNMNEIYQY